MACESCSKKQRFECATHGAPDNANCDFLRESLSGYPQPTKLTEQDLQWLRSVGVEDALAYTVL